MQHDSDFHEGVRALLVDRDNAPKWKHASYKDVTPELVATYFAPLTGQPEWAPNQHAAAKL